MTYDPKDFKIKSLEEMEFPYSPDRKCKGFTPLMVAVINDSSSLDVKNVNAQNEVGWTALMIACRNSAPRPKGWDLERMVRALVKTSDLNIQTKNGETALMIACMYQNDGSTYETVKTLLENGADPNIKTNPGNTALYYAKDKEVRDLLIAAMNKPKNSEEDKKNNEDLKDQIYMLSNNIKKCLDEQIEQQHTTPNKNDISDVVINFSDIVIKSLKNTNSRLKEKNEKLDQRNKTLELEIHEAQEKLEKYEKLN